MIWRGRHGLEWRGAHNKVVPLPVPSGLIVPGVTLPLCSSLPAGTWQTPAHLPHLGMHLRRGAGHAGDGTRPEQEEEEVRRLPVHGWVSQASRDFGGGAAGVPHALCAQGPALW